METKTDQSYGVIAYAKTVAGQFEYFLIHQYSSWRNDSYWGFPKGHAETGETPEQTAIRELQEETQLLIESFNNSVLFEVAYDFTHKDVLIKKTVAYFVAEAASRAYTLDGHEVHEAGWFTFNEALKRLTHESSRKLLTDAHEYLQIVDR